MSSRSMKSHLRQHEQARSSFYGMPQTEQGGVIWHLASGSILYTVTIAVFSAIEGLGFCLIEHPT